MVSVDIIDAAHVRENISEDAFRSVIRCQSRWTTSARGKETLYKLTKWNNNKINRYI